MNLSELSTEQLVELSQSMAREQEVIRERRREIRQEIDARIESARQARLQEELKKLQEAGLQLPAQTEE